MAKNFAILFGVVFLLVGVLGFIMNPIVGSVGFFHADTVHNLVHVLSGIVFLIVAFTAPAQASLAMRIFGIVYILVAILGFFVIDASGMGSILGIVGINSADNWLHVFLAVVIFGASMMTKPKMMQTASM